MCALSRMEHKTLCRTSIIIDAVNAGVRLPVLSRTFRAVLLMNRWRMDDDDDHDHRYTRDEDDDPTVRSFWTRRNEVVTPTAQ